MDGVLVLERRAQRLAGRRVPEPCRMIFAGGNDPCSIEAELGGVYLLVMEPDLRQPWALADHGGQANAVHLLAFGVTGLQPQSIHQRRQ